MTKLLPGVVALADRFPRRKWSECHCGCHTSNGTMMHIVACCDGSCIHCGKFISRGGMKAHLAEYHENLNFPAQEKKPV